MEEVDDQIIHGDASEVTPAKDHSPVLVSNGTSKNISNGTFGADLSKETEATPNFVTRNEQDLEIDQPIASPSENIVSAVDDVDFNLRDVNMPQNSHSPADGEEPDLEGTSNPSDDVDGVDEKLPDTNTEEGEPSDCIEMPLATDPCEDDNPCADSEPNEGFNDLTEDTEEVDKVAVADTVGSPMSSRIEREELQTSFVNESALGDRDVPTNDIDGEQQLREVLLDAESVASDCESGTNNEDQIPDGITRKKLKKSVRFADGVTEGIGEDCV